MPYLNTFAYLSIFWQYLRKDLRRCENYKQIHITPKKPGQKRRIRFYPVTNDPHRDIAFEGKRNKNAFIKQSGPKLALCSVPAHHASSIYPAVILSHSTDSIHRILTECADS